MDEGRPLIRHAGRREEDALLRELVRALLEKEKYMTELASDKRYVLKAERADGRDWTLRILLAVVAIGQIVEAAVIAGLHG